MSLIKNTNAVSEVLGAAVLLAIAVSSVSVMYTQVLSEPGPSPETEVTLIGKLENGVPEFSHQRGEELGLDTKIILTIAGYEEYQYDPTQSSEGSNLNEEWNIGERLTFPDLNTEGLQVRATIIDKLSNSIVFWGILQQGETIRGKGGIWHLDDTTTPGFALDSSGYENHGAVFGAQWIENGGRHGSALQFDGLNDFVRVPSSYSLYDSNAITVEAWMKSEPFDTILSNRNFNVKFGYNPDIIHVTGDIYAIAAEGKQQVGAHQGIVIALNITDDGNVTYENIHNDSYIFDPVCGYTPDIINVSGSIFAVAYQGPPNEQQGDGFLKTVEILPNGTINQTVLDSFEFDPQEAHEPKIVHINQSVYAITYRGLDDQGFLRTLEIYNNGTINKTDIDIWQFEISDAVYQPDITRFINTTFTITYSNGTQGNPPGALIRIDILPNGTIKGDTAQVLVEPIGVDPQYVCYESCVIKISDQIIAVAYREQGQGQGHPGYILTAGVLSDTIPPYLRGVYKTDSYGIFANLTAAVALINDHVIFAPLIPNEWHHVAMTYNKTRGMMRLYITQDQYDTIEYSIPLNEQIQWNTNDIIFGKLFCGIVDEIAIFARELSLDELRIHMYNPSSMEASLE